MLVRMKILPLPHLPEKQIIVNIQSYQAYELQDLKITEDEMEKVITRVPFLLVSHCQKLDLFSL